MKLQIIFTIKKRKALKEQINRHEILTKITPLIKNTAMRFNLIPIEIDFEKENHRWFLRIFLFAHDRGVTLDDCENVTRSLNDFLDELIPCKYYLEVSSPGLDRKFKSDKEYLFFRGKNISIKLKEPLDEENDNIFKAKLIDYDEAKRNIYVKRLSDEKELILNLNDIKNTRLYIEQ